MLNNKQKEKAVQILRNLVAFLVLMENGNGVVDKSPDYIMEKFQRYCGKDDDSLMSGLDSDNKRKLTEWCERWLQPK